MFIPSSLAARGPRLVASFFIFALSSGVVGGVIFYLDWTGPEVFQAGVQQVPVDMQLELTWAFYQQNATSLENITHIAQEQQYVTATEVVSCIQTWDYNQTNYEYSELTYLGVDDSLFHTFQNAIHLTPGSPQLNDSTCYVQKETLGFWGTDVGKNLTFHAYSYDEHGNRIELNQTLRVVGVFSSQLFSHALYYLGPQISTLRVVTTRHSMSIAFGNPNGSGYASPEQQIWVALDRGAVIRSGAAVATTQLNDIARRIEQRALPFADVANNGFKLLDAVSEFSAWSSSMSAVSVCASLPTIIMGVMLVNYESTLSADQRRRDTGTLKTRGASGSQAFMWIMTAALFTGLVGSVGAVIVGYLAAALSGTVRTLLEFQFSQLQVFTFAPPLESLAFVFGFSFTVGFIVALPSAVRALTMSATEAHAAIAREDLSVPEMSQTPWADIIALGISAFVLTGIIGVFSYVADPSIQASILFTMVWFLALFLFSFTRILSRPAASVQARVLSWLKRPSLSAGARIVSRNLVLYRKTQSLGVVFLAMVFTAGLFSGVSATTGYYHMRDLLMFESGADVRIDISSGKENLTLNIVNNLTAVDGVSSVAAMFSTNAYIRYADASYFGTVMQNRSIRMFAVQPSKWFQAGFWLPYFAYSGDPQASLQRLAQSNSSVITSFKPVISRSYSPSGETVTYGNSLELTVPGTSWVNRSTCTIVDVLAQNLEGQGETYFPGQPDLSDFLIINLPYVQSCLRTAKIDSLYIHLNDNANYTKVIQDLHSIAPDSFKTIDSGLKRIDDALASRAGRAVFGVYTLNIVFSVAFLTLGVGLVSVERIHKLRRQLSVFRAIGGETRSISISVAVETVVGLMIAAAIGALLSLVLTYLFMKIPLMFFGTETAGIWSRLPIGLVVPTELLLSIVGLTFLCSLCSTLIVTKRGLSANIAEEIQVEE